MKASTSLLIAFLPALAAAQMRLFAVEESNGTVLGRVCRDLDGDGRCAEQDPGVEGARLLLDGGQVATTDGAGRFHFLSVPGRILAPGRSAYGGHALVLEGPWSQGRVRRYFELPPGGVAHVELALPVAPERPASRIEPSERSPSFSPSRREQGLLWTLSGKSPPGSQVTLDGRAVSSSANGDYSVEVYLRARRNVFAITVTEPGGRLDLFLQEVHFVTRSRGGDAVVPYPPERLAQVELPPPETPARGRELQVRGRVEGGVILKIEGAEIHPAKEGTFELRLPLSTGDIALAIEAKKDSYTVIAAPRLRFERRAGAIVGLADLELSLPGKNRFFTGRGALAARGTYDQFEGEIGVDLDDRDRSLDALLHPRTPETLEHRLVPEYTFPTAGDQAVAADPNAGRGRIYAHVEAPGARLDLGSMRPDFTRRELGRYDRSLYGGRLSGEGQLGSVRLEGTVFGSSLRSDPGQIAPPRPAHDELTATGGSLYYLRRGEVVAGSERLRVEWRDGRSGLLVKERTLVRAVDYEIDYLAGRVLLARPLSSVSPPPSVVTGEPFSSPEAVLLVDYSFADAMGIFDDSRGGRGALDVGPLRFEASAASEDRPGGQYLLNTVAVELTLGSPLRVRAELARSQGAALERSGENHYGRSLDGGITFVTPAVPANGDHAGFHLEANGEAGGARYGGWWRERPRGYSDSSHLETVNAFERGATASLALNGTELYSAFAERRGADPRDPSGVAIFDSRELKGRIGQRVGALGLTAEVVGSRIETMDEVGSQWSGGIRADLRVAPWLSFDASHHQSISREGAGPAMVDATFSAVGATLAGKGRSLAARGGWGPALGTRWILSGEQREPGEVVYGTFSMDPDTPCVLQESVSTLGLRRRQGNAEAFSESQFARDPFGLRASRVNGMSVELAEGVKLSASAETGSRLRLDDTLVERRAAGASASWVMKRLRLAARGELREEGGDRQAVAGGSAEWRVNERLTLSSRGSWSNGTWAGRRVYFAAATLGGAWRSDDWSLLGKLAGISELRPGSVQRDTGLGSLAVTANVGARLTLGVGAHLGLTRLAGAREDLVSGSVRASYRIFQPVDVAVEYARRQSLNGTNPGSLDGARAEVGCGLGEGRIALGYNLLGFSGSGVDPGEEAQGRVYLRAELVY